MGTKPGQLTNSSQGQLKIWPLRHQHCKETQGLLSSWSSGRISKDTGKQRPDRTDTGWRRCRLPERDLQSLATQLHLLGRERGGGEEGAEDTQESASTGGVCTSQGGSHLGAIELASWGALRGSLAHAAPTHARELEGGTRPTQCNK